MNNEPQEKNPQENNQTEEETKAAKPRPVRMPRWNPHSFGLKILLIGILLLIFLIPIQMITHIVSERQWRRSDVEREILSSQGGEVMIGGPVMVVPMLREIQEVQEVREEGETKDVTITTTYEDAIYILPESLDIRAYSASEIKSRGIYSVPVYDLLLEGRGSFVPGEVLSRYNPEEILWDRITIQFSYPALKGMKNIKPFLWNGEETAFQPGGNRAIPAYDSMTTSIYPSIISVPVALNGENSTRYSFRFSQEIEGGESLQFLPLAEETLVTLESDWPTPSFNGYYLPNDSHIGEEGFSAEWQINYLSRGIPQSWTMTNSDVFARIGETAFGVRFFPVVTSYDKINRTLKYSPLFLMLPFLTFFLFEVTRKHRIHPVQYVLAGAGNLVFYLLLLSLSEHMPFNGSYLIASLAVTVMLTAYAVSVLKARRSGLILLPVMGLSYGFLYFVLQSEDYALLMGSTGLFALIGLIMYLTRKVEWYRKGTES